MLENALIFLFMLFVIGVVFPLMIAMFIIVSRKVIRKNLEKGNSVFETSFKYSYKANFVVWALIFVLIYYGSDISRYESPKFIFVLFLVIYLIGTTATTLTSGLLISYITKQSLKRKNNLEFDIKNKEIKKETVEPSDDLLIVEIPNLVILKEKSIFDSLKEHVNTPYGIYFNMILAVVYGLFYRFVFDGFSRFFTFFFMCFIPFLIAITPAILGQEEMKKSISKQFFYPIICITLFLVFGVGRNADDLFFIVVFMYLPFTIITGLASVLVFFIKHKKYFR